MGCVREKGTERWDKGLGPKAMEVKKDVSEISWKGALTGILKGTEPKANAFKLLHGQQEVQGSNEGLSDALMEK